MAKILVIDNNPQDARLAQKLLGNAGHDVIIASTGQTGLNKLDEIMPDLVLVDTNLPDIDAHHLVGLIHKNYPQIKTPIVAYTAWSVQVARQLVDSYSLDGAILKPIDTHQFANKISNYLMRAATR